MRSMADDRAMKIGRGLRERLDKRSRQHGGGKELAAGFHGSFFVGKRFEVKDWDLIFYPIFYQLFMGDRFIQIEHQSGHERMRGQFKCCFEFTGVFGMLAVMFRSTVEFA